MRKQLIDIVIYIDDTFLRAASYDRLLYNLRVTQETFNKCGFTINLEKSCLVPTKRMEFLGFILNSLAFTIVITPDKSQGLANLIEGVLQKPNKKITIRFLAKIIGRMVSFFPASDKAKLHYRTLERFKSKMIHCHKS